MNMSGEALKMTDSLLHMQAKLSSSLSPEFTSGDPEETRSNEKSQLFSQGLNGHLKKKKDIIRQCVRYFT